MLTEQAIAAISGATVIFGSKRAIALAAAHIPRECRVKEMTTFRPEHRSLTMRSFSRPVTPNSPASDTLGGRSSPAFHRSRSLPRGSGSPLSGSRWLSPMAKNMSGLLPRWLQKWSSERSSSSLPTRNFPLRRWRAPSQGPEKRSRLPCAKTSGIPARESRSGPLQNRRSRSPGSSRCSWAGQACSQKDPGFSEGHIKEHGIPLFQE